MSYWLGRGGGEGIGRVRRWRTGMRKKGKGREMCPGDEGDHDEDVNDSRDGPRSSSLPVRLRGGDRAPSNPDLGVKLRLAQRLGLLSDGEHQDVGNRSLEELRAMVEQWEGGSGSEENEEDEMWYEEEFWDESGEGEGAVMENGVETLEPDHEEGVFVTVEEDVEEDRRVGDDDDEEEVGYAEGDIDVLF
ncbi:MAG: hypothetical protein Q9219_000714 [cf. Caloplaca sp. 3 TL-2023]